MQSLYKYSLVIILSLIILTGLMMPGLGAVLPLAFLLMPIELNRSSRLFFCLTSIFFISVVVSSRAIGVAGTDDFWDGYWPLYQQIKAGYWIEIFKYGDGFEPGLGVLFWVLSNIFGGISPRFLMFILVFLNQLLLLLWAEFYLPKVSVTVRHRHQAALSLILFFFSGLLASQIVRQSFASVFLLIAVFSRGIYWRIFFVAMGSIFHITTLPLYLLIYGFRKYFYLCVLALAFLGLAIYTNAANIIYSLLDLTSGGVGYSKVVFYEGQAYTSSNVLEIGIIFLFQLLVIALLYIRGKKEYEYVSAKRIYFGFIVLFLILLPLPFASLRSTLYINSTAFGYFLLVAVPNRYFPLARIIIISFMLLVTARSFFPEPSNPFRLWDGYDFAGSPGYFFAEIFK